MSEESIVPTDERRPYFQMFTRDWLSGQATCAMTPEQKGAFIDLLCHSWNSEVPCTLPDDDVMLARLSGLGDRWTACGAFVKAQFKPIGDGRLRNGKLWKLYEEWQGISSTKSASGAAGGRARAANIAARKLAEFNQTASTVQADDKQNASTEEAETEQSSDGSQAKPKPSLTLASSRDTQRGIALAGTLPREHLNHGWCGDCRKCVPGTLHGEFVRNLGGDAVAAGAKLSAFYEATMRAIPATAVISENPFDFWRPRFEVAFPSTVPAPVKKQAETGRRVAGADETADYLKKLRAGGK